MHVECSNCFPSFGRFEWVSGLFGAKKGSFGEQNAQFWEGTTRLGATGEFLAQNLNWQGHHLDSRMATVDRVERRALRQMRQSNSQNGVGKHKKTCFRSELDGH